MVKIDEHLGLIGFTLKKYLGGIYEAYRDKEDLYQVGYLALHRAAENFDESKGTSFTTYAVNFISGSVKNFIRDDRFFSGLGDRDTRMKGMGNKVISMTSKFDEDSFNLEEKISFEKDCIGELERRIFIEELLSILKPKEKEVIRLLYLQDKTQCQAAKILGVSQVQISRIKNASLQKLRGYAV